ncbi:MAG: NADH-quinone oxidoreductase subunit G, partial [Alphaproteobacteria bacterium]|nr:NADH-quinone oxidoreductase subunit G [Alphaproteobacteria bacterium]
QAAEMLGIEIPRFCYHDKLSVPANCRMCLVEIEGGPPKPQPSCALAATDGMVVKTDTPMVHKARKGVMEMLLINHPLDCPICDQGGECDLQDQAMGYGYDRSRYYESKRAVRNKDLGPLVKTNMTRCIQCTRCVRFCDEIAGTGELGLVNRGEDVEITPYGGEYVTTELSGNLVDICPVGALTSKPYAFQARPWELRKTETIDVHDGLGCNIRVDARGNEVMRILPRLNEDINEEWIDDRTRFSYDGLKKRRLDKPFIKDRETNRLRPATWDEAFAFIADNLSGLKGEQIAALAGDLCEIESMVALKDLMKALDCKNLDCRTDGSRFDTSVRAGYLFNSGIAGIEEADAILIVGSNPRHEAALVNARIRKTWLQRRIKIGVIGAPVNLTYPYEHLGTGPRDLEKLLKARSGFAKTLKDARRPMIILGAGCFQREDGEAVQALGREVAEKFGMVAEDWNGFNVLHNAASRVGGIEAGFLPGEGGRGFHDILEGTKKGTVKALYLLGVDTFDPRAAIGWKTFVIYQGHHGDLGAHGADVILPGAAYTEKDGLYVNTEGRVQMGKKAVWPPGDAREDWTVIRALSDVLGHRLPYNSLVQLRERIVKERPAFGDVDALPKAEWGKFGGRGDVLSDDFKDTVENFYLTNAVCRASVTMARCSQAFTCGKAGKEAA